MRLLLYICIGIGLVLCEGSCGSSREGRGMSLSAVEYYDLGRYARLDEDWEGAIGYFEKALSAAEVAGSDYYRGYACQQLSALWAMAYEYPTALDYARSSVVALEACGETAGALLSRLAMASHHLSLGDPAAAQALLPPLRAAFSSPDSPAAPRLSHLEAAVLSRPSPGPSPVLSHSGPGPSPVLSHSGPGASPDRGGAGSNSTPCAGSSAVTTSLATEHPACTPHAASPAACGHAARGTSCSAFAAGNASLARGGASSPESSDFSVGRAGCSVDRGGADACVGSSAGVGSGSVGRGDCTASTHSSVAASPAACGHAARGTSCTNASAGVACTGAPDQLASGASVSAGAHNLAATTSGAAPRKNPIEKKH